MSEPGTGGCAAGAIRREGGGATALGAADWVSLAAAPTFALMALLTAAHGDRPAGILCLTADDGLPMSGMTLMYGLMGVFHATPWLRLVTRRRMAARGIGARTSQEIR
jgi:hypothetical protein